VVPGTKLARERGTAAEGGGAADTVGRARWRHYARSLPQCVRCSSRGGTCCWPWARARRWRYPRSGDATNTRVRHGVATGGVNRGRGHYERRDA